MAEVVDTIVWRGIFDTSGANFAGFTSKARRELSGFQGSFNTFNREVGRGLTTTGKILWDFASDSVKALAEFESAFTDVAKKVPLEGTFDDATSELGKLARAIREVSLQELSGVLDAEQVAGIVAGSAQLGVAKENLLGFSTGVGQVAIALEQDVTKTSTALAKIIKQFDLSQTQEQVLKVGSSINEISQNTIATAADIFDMVGRMTGSATAMGLSVEELIGIAGALRDNVPMSVRKTSTAMNRFLLALIGDTGSFLDAFEADAEGYIETLDMTQDEFGNLVNKSSEMLNAFGLDSATFKQLMEDNPVAAINSIVSAMGEMKKNQGADVLLATMQDILGTGDGVTQLVLNIAGAQEDIAKGVALSTQAARENISVIDEFGRVAGTQENRFKLLNEQWTELQRQGGEVLKPFTDFVLNNAIAAIDELLNNGGQFLNFFAQSINETFGGLEVIPANIGSLYSGFFSDTQGHLDELKNHAGSVALELIKMFGELYTSGLKDIGGLAADGAVKFGQFFYSTLDKFPELARAVTVWTNDGLIAIGGFVVEGLKLIDSGFARIDEVGMQLLENMVTAITKIVNAITGGITQAIDTTVQSIDRLGGAFDKVFQNEKAIGFFEKITDKIYGVEHALEGGSLTPALYRNVEAWLAVSDEVTNTSGILEEQPELIETVEYAYLDMGTALKNIGNLLGEVGGQFGSFGQGALNLTANIGELSAAFSDVGGFTGLFSGGIATLIPGIGTLAPIISATIPLVKGLWDGIKGLFKESQSEGTKAAESFENFLGTINGGQELVGAFGNMRSAMNAAGHDFQTFLNQTGGTFAATFGGITGEIGKGTSAYDIFVEAVGLASGNMDKAGQIALEMIGGFEEMGFSTGQAAEKMLQIAEASGLSQTRLEALINALSRFRQEAQAGVAIPGLASGGVASGLAITNERGSEIAQFPGGSMALLEGSGPRLGIFPEGTRIIPHGRSMSLLRQNPSIPRMQAGGTITNNTNAPATYNLNINGGMIDRATIKQIYIGLKNFEKGRA